MPTGAERMADHSQQDNLELDDGTLLERMLAGEEDAFVALYRRRQAPLYRFALRMTGSHAAAEDAVQETFLVFMRQAARYESARGSVRSFLYGIARNCIRRAIERSATLQAVSDAEMESRLEHHAESERESWFGAAMRAASAMEESLSRSEEIAVLRRAILVLPEHYREVVLLCDLEELSYEEAAAALGCAIGTVRSRLHRARAMLGERLRHLSAEDSEESARTGPAVAARNEKAADGGKVGRPMECEA